LIFLAAVGARWAWGVSQRAWQSEAPANSFQSIRSNTSSVPSCWIPLTCQEIGQQPADRQQCLQVGFVVCYSFKWVSLQNMFK